MDYCGLLSRYRFLFIEFMAQVISISVYDPISRVIGWITKIFLKTKVVQDLLRTPITVTGLYIVDNDAEP